MTQKINKKTWTVMAIGITALLLVPFFYFRSFQLSQEFNQSSVAGVIISRNENSLEIEDVRKGIKKIMFDDKLIIDKGRSQTNLSSLATGTFVIVELDPIQTENLRAVKLRILDPRGPKLNK